MPEPLTATPEAPPQAEMAVPPSKNSMLPDVGVPEPDETVAV